MNGVVLSVGGERQGGINQPYYPQFKESLYILSILTACSDETKYSRSSPKKMQV